MKLNIIERRGVTPMSSLYKRVDYQALINFSADVLQRIGYPRNKAEITAKVLVEADARGVASHGVTRLKVYKTN